MNYANIGSENGLSSEWYQAIIGTNAGLDIYRQLELLVEVPRFA